MTAPAEHGQVMMSLFDGLVTCQGTKTLKLKHEIGMTV